VHREKKESLLISLAHWFFASNKRPQVLGLRRIVRRSGSGLLYGAQSLNKGQDNPRANIPGLNPLQKLFVSPELCGE
jgi:hypothetical protein